MTTASETAEAETAPSAPTWRHLIGEVLARRESPRGGGYLAAMRAAAIPATEVNALGYTERYLSTLRTDQRTGARRAAGICATAVGARQPQRGENGSRTYRPIGASLRDLYVKVNGSAPSSLDSSGNQVNNAMLMQINSLPMLDLETAAATFGLLIDRCSAHHISVDYYDLAYTLINWGNGISPASQQTRAKVLTGFYTNHR